MAICEAIILAGGLGTRLKDAVPDVPKCMAPVNGKPFLSYLIDHLQLQGVTYFIFALGNRGEMIEEFLKIEYPSLFYKASYEEEPLGTGGRNKKSIKDYQRKIGAYCKWRHSF